ncbi:MAG: biotin transporter BioY [Lachnospiraceae bacterium]|nr:biotin transporter BioY [Lachnospiraceae bacterium]
MTSNVNTKTRFKVVDLAYIGLFVALMAICSWISVPTAVPFTLQTFAIFTAIGLLGGKRGTISILLYLMIGAVGVPVFAGFKSGPGALFGMTGGYLIGFIFTGLIMWGITAAFGKKLYILAIADVIGLIVCYAFGTVWFSYLYFGQINAASIGSSLSMCVIPFIIPDLCKIGISLMLVSRLRKYISE